MRDKYITNGVRLVGKVEKKRSFDNITILTINTGKNTRSEEYYYPEVCAFGKVKSFADMVEAGDSVLIDASIQTDKGENGTVRRTITANHINKLGTDDFKYVNNFSLFGRVISTKKVSDNKASAVVVVEAKKPNFVKVIFESTPAVIDRFCRLNKNNYVNIFGYIKTYDNENQIYKDSCAVTGFKHVKPPERD